MQIYINIACLVEEESVTKAADNLYETLQTAKIAVLYDDRHARPGEKFADADLMGIPRRVVVSAKTLEAGKYEYKGRTEKETKLLEKNELLNKLAVGI